MMSFQLVRVERKTAYWMRSAWTRRVMTIVKKKTTTSPPQARQSHGERERRDETMAAERRQIAYEQKGRVSGRRFRE